jgi:glutathione S-transferase
VDAVMRATKGELGGVVPFASPILRAGKNVIAQTANILDFLGRRLRLVRNEAAARIALQHQLTIADLLNEVHDTHHPISSGLYYEQQKAAAKRRAHAFLQTRMPKFLLHFERLLAENRTSRGKWLVDRDRTYVDLSMFQMMEGLAYAFPRNFRRFSRKVPGLVGLRDRVAARPRIAAYLASERRIPFNEDGIFRHYSELDR